MVTFSSLSALRYARNGWYLSICLSVYLSICLSVCVYLCKWDSGMICLWFYVKCDLKIIDRKLCCRKRFWIREKEFAIWAWIDETMLQKTLLNQRKRICYLSLNWWNNLNLILTSSNSWDALPNLVNTEMFIISLEPYFSHTQSSAHCLKYRFH